jgi:iron complex transport system substrate-binding protein
MISRLAGSSTLFRKACSRIPVFAGMTLLGCSTQPSIPPGGIVSNNPCIDAILAQVAAPGQIAAVSAYSQDPESGSAPLAWARALPAMGTSAEEIIAAKPRLVLTGNLASSGTNAALTKAGVKLAVFGVPLNVEESAAQVRSVARQIGRAAAGEKLAATIEEAAKMSPPRQSTAIIWQTGGFVAGQGTLQDELLTRAGYTNASVTYGLKRWDVLPLETLIRRPPDVIFMPLSARGEDARALAARKRLLRYTNGKTRIVNFPDKLLFCGGPTIPQAMRLLRS